MNRIRLFASICSIGLMRPGNAFLPALALILASWCMVVLSGCREAGMEPESDGIVKTVPVRETGSTKEGACLFNLCTQAIPLDSAGMAGLAALVRDSASAMGMGWWVNAPAFTPRPDSFIWIQTDKLGYSLRLGRQGLFPRVDVTVKVAGSGGILTLRATALVGQRKSLAGFPAVGRMDYGNNLYLAGNTNVYGPLLMWSGETGFASDYDIRWTGTTRTLVTWKAENPIWGRLPLTFPGTMDWMASQDSLLDASDPEGAAFQDSWYPTSPVATGTVVRDSTVADARIFTQGRVVLGAGSVLRNCMVVAGQVEIEKDAHIENSLIYGRERLTITGSPSLTGQYLSRDSLYLETEAPFSGYPLFYVHGNLRKSIGRLVAVKASGEAMLMYGGASNVANDGYYAHLITGTGVDIKGLIYANGNATIAGTTHGSVLFDRPIYMSRGGTLFMGFLVNAQYYPPDPASILPMPLLLDPADAVILSTASTLAFQAK